MRAGSAPVFVPRAFCPLGAWSCLHILPQSFAASTPTQSEALLSPPHPEHPGSDEARASRRLWGSKRSPVCLQAAVREEALEHVAQVSPPLVHGFVTVAEQLRAVADQKIVDRM